MAKTIVILGAGFAGISTAVQLARRLRPKDGVRIVLIDQHRQHTYTPLLYEVVSGGLRECIRPDALESGSAVPLSIDGKLIDHPFVEFRQGRVTNIDAKNRSVRLKSNNKVSYDYLVVALGAHVNTFGTPGVNENGFTIKSIDDALKIHLRICELIKKTNCGELSSMNIVIAGGGPTGVEMASELAVSLKRAVQDGVVKCPWNVTIVDASERLLSMMSPAVTRRAIRRLTKLGVDVISGTLVKEVGESWAIVGPNGHLDSNVSPYTKDASIESDILIWTAGICANKACSDWGLPTSERGYVHTDDTLRAVGLDDVYAIGDMATIQDRDTPQVAAEAIAQGKCVAENIVRSIQGASSKRKYVSSVWPWAIPLGGKWAIAHYRFLTVGGVFGYVFRKVVDLRYFMYILSPIHAIRVWWHGAKVYLQNEQ